MEHPIRVLLVCSGNICRSPMAEGMLGARAARRGIDLEVMSCGLSFDDHPATAEAVRAARARGADIRSHRSAIIAAERINEADLVIGMERHHVREAVVREPTAMAKSFTFKDLVRRGEAIGPRHPDEPMAGWLERIGAGRRAADLMGFDPDDEVADPYRRPMPEYDRCADEIADLVDRLLDLAWPDQAEGAA